MHSRRRVASWIISLAGLVALVPAARAGSLAYSATNVLERWQNDGGIVSTPTITLSGDNFTGTNNEDFVLSLKVQTNNVPSGLTVAVTRTATNKLTLSFTGNAVNHTFADRINNLSLVFQNSAFSNNSAAAITGASGTNLTVTYLTLDSSNIWVATTGSDTTGDGSVANPYATVTKALTLVRASANDVIRLKPGLYTENGMSKGDFAFTIAGDTRDNTILQAFYAPNSPVKASILSLGALVASSRGVAIRNLTLRHGSTSGSGAAVNCGGNNGMGDLIIENCRLTLNAAGTGGGALYWFSNGGSGKIWLLNSEFSSNTCTGASGGGAVWGAGVPMIISNCVFRANASTGGGGAAKTVSVQGYGSLFVGNTCSGSGGALNFDNAPGTFDTCTFAYNSATNHGGATYTDNNGVTLHRYVNCTIYSNSAGQLGGGVRHAAGNTGNSVSFYNSTVFGNTATNGGGIYRLNAVNLYSTIVASNQTPAGAAQDIAGGALGTVTNSLVGVNDQTGLTAGSPTALGNYVGTVAAPVDVRLLPLADNGGLRLADGSGCLPTCAPQNDSVAIDHGCNVLGAVADGRSAPYPRVSGAQADIGAYEYGTPVLPSFVCPSNVFLGAPDGSILSTNTILLATSGSDTFSGVNGQDFVTAGWITCSNVPAGLTVSAIRAGDTNLNVTLTGLASPPTNNFNLVLVFNAGALNTSAFVSNSFASVNNRTLGNLAVIFSAGAGAPALLYDGVLFSEVPANNGVITNVVTITLTNALFADFSPDDFIALGRLQVSNVPSGLTARAVMKEPYRVPQVLTVSLNGAATRHNSSSNTNPPAAFQDSAFRSVSAAAVASATTNLQVQFLNPVLTWYAKNFYESWRNDGAISNTLSAVVFGDAFNGTLGENLYASGKVTPVNLPAGLTPVVTLQSATGIVVTLTGNAAPHTSAQSTSSLGFTFANSAFVFGEASLVTNYSVSDLAVTFLSQNPSNWYVNGSTGSDTINSGLSRTSPFRTITNALARAQSAANDIIYIMAGTNTVPPGGISITKSVTFWGDSPDNTIIQAHDQPFVATNTSLFKFAATRTNAVFRNLTLRNGRAPNGGAIYTGVRVELFAYNCAFLNNAATNGGGGAIYGTGQYTFDYCQLSDCTFTNNTGTAGGGAISFYRLMTPVLASNCVFFANSSGTNGGAIFYESQYGGAALINTLFLNNRAGPSSSGGAYYCGGTGCTLDMNRCAVIGNIAPLIGGGVFASGPTTLSNCTFSLNVASNAAGGFCAVSGTPVIFNSTFFQNTAPTAGAVRSYGAPVLLSTILASNTATTGFAPDLQCTYSSGIGIATNSLIGITNNAFTAASPTLASAGPDTANAFSNYCGTAAAPQNPKLLPAAANGGTAVGATGFKWPVYTCALMSDSVAIDHGANLLGLTTDGRGTGYARVVGVSADMGAYEYGAVLEIPGTLLLFR
jgi:hypothetical protein